MFKEKDKVKSLMEETILLSANTVSDEINRKATAEDILLLSKALKNIAEAYQMVKQC